LLPTGHNNDQGGSGDGLGELQGGCGGSYGELLRRWWRQGGQSSSKTPLTAFLFLFPPKFFSRNIFS
jgi:hypothetical protein